MTVNPLSDAPSTTDLRGQRIAVVISYLEGRERDCEANLYPRSHLWGADALARAGAAVVFVRPPAGHLFSGLRWLEHRAKGRLGNLELDMALLLQAHRFDVLYAPNARLPLTQALRMLRIIAAPLIYWAYVPPSNAPWWKLRMLWERWPLSRGIDAVLCLTPLCAATSKTRWSWARTRFVDWGADGIMFPGTQAPGRYFFACGRTNRDYVTLLAAARQVPVPVTILVSRSFLQDEAIPPNVTILEGPADAGTDNGLSYKEVVALYADARAVLICRRDVPGDTSGLTNLLEALAMGRPTAITRTGALDLDVEQAGVGRFIAPGDVQAWVQLMTDWSVESDELRAMRISARRVVDEHYNHLRHGRDVTAFVHELVGGLRPASTRHRHGSDQL